MKKCIQVILICSLISHVAFAQNLVTDISQRNSLQKADTIFTVIDSKTSLQSYDTKNADGTSESGFLLAGKKEGNIMHYYANGVLLSMQQFKNGLQDGLTFICDKNGAVEWEENYKDGKLDGLVKNYITSKNVRIVKSIYHYKNGLADGNQSEYNEMGKLSSESNYKAGKKQGVSKWYYQNGMLAMQQNYVNDLIDGAFLSFSQTGKIITKGFYVNGKKNGAWTEYFEGGELKTEGAYKEDEKTGNWKQYDINGAVIKTESF